MTKPAQDTWIPRPAGDRAIVLEFGQSISRDVVDQVGALDTCLHAAIDAGILAGVLETIPTFRSLALIFDPLATTPDVLLGQIRKLERTSHHTSDANKTAQAMADTGAIWRRNRP